MAIAINNKALSICAAEQLIESVSEPANTRLYLAVGKIDPWDDDAAPPQPGDSVQEKINIWKNLHFAKKITGNDMCLVAPRYNWTQNTIYLSYTHQSANLFGNTFYVMTSAFNVYKCLDNNRGANSSIEPSYTNPSITSRTSDGYLWKFLYTVRRGDRLRFMTDDWLPVRRLTMDDGTTQFDTQDAAVPGSINAIIVANGGAGFYPNVNVIATITGDGSNARANVVVDANTNTVNYIVVSAAGADYSYANVVITANSTASGVVANVTIAPFGGHGSNPVDELGASTVMINIRLKGTENSKVQVGNDFRQVSIIRDPTLRSDTTQLASNTVILNVMDINLAGSGSNYVSDEWVYQGGSLADFTFKGKVVYFTATGNLIELANTEGTISSSSLIGDTSAATRFVTDFSNTELEPYSGDVLYIDNIVPINRSSEQTDDIKIAIGF